MIAKQFKLTYCPDWCQTSKKPEFNVTVNMGELKTAGLSQDKDGAIQYFNNFFPRAILLKVNDKEYTYPGKK